MEDNKFNLTKRTGKIPRLKDNAFNLRQLSMREFEAFMILLMHEGEEQPLLKKLIDIEFHLRSSTKGYDYINNLCKKGFAHKKKTTVKGKQVTRIYIGMNKEDMDEKDSFIDLRKEYEKFMLPTISSLRESLNEIIKDYIDGIKEEEKIREKFRSYTETILQAINHVLEDTPNKSLNKKKLQKKLIDTIWRYFRAEMLKTEMFSR